MLRSGSLGGEGLVPAKAVFFVKRRPGIEVAALRELFLSRELTAVRSLRPRRYVQHHALPGGYRRGEPAFDLVVELSLAADEPDLDVLGGVGACSAAAAAAVDRSRSLGMVVTEVLVKSGAPAAGGVTAFAPVCRRPDQERDEFFRYWRDVHGPTAAAIPQLVRYVQCHAVRPVRSAEGQVLEGCAVTWFDSTAAMREAAATPEYAATRADEPNFVAGVPPQVITTEQARLGEEAV